MIRDRSWLGAATLLFCIVGCGASTVTPANFARLKPGMTQAEVEAVLGQPAAPGVKPRAKDSGLQVPFTMVRWGDDAQSITVGFDDEGKAAVIWQKGVLEK